MQPVQEDKGKRPERLLRLLCHSVSRLTEEMLGMIEEEVSPPRNRRRQRCHIRQMSMYLCHVVLGIPQYEIARAFGYDRSTVSYACHVVEDRREDKAMDQLLLRLERVVGVLLAVSKEADNG
ncbi:helix-turn-helix domain-containing protein [Rhizobium paknamense]|uniref:Chromosomal replication initiation ATPase DnaA n=1 Tax=Rhizobium paknamense TaxID=1206817 RepID=A0ABU0I7U9_9HYPH|nr:helix-turn-helix domain-containing protein [Rhizobium paknamense]MDQ0454304.1 chromosomal replication initiation ATPase DnaA [Rhizobium paknamense]